MDIDQIIRLKRQNLIESRIQDLLDNDPTEVCIDLINLAISTYAKTYKPSLTPVEIQKIKDNYPDATSALITERAMAEDGLELAVSSALYMAKIAIDYSPLSHCKNDMDRDETLHTPAQKQLNNNLHEAYQEGTLDGMSPFGVSACMILNGAFMGMEAGVSWPMLCRPLLDAIELVMEKQIKPSQEEIEEMVIAQIMSQMDVSRAVAKKYIANAKKHTGPL